MAMKLKLSLFSTYADALDVELWTSFAAEHILQQTAWEEYIQTLLRSFPITTATPLKLDANDIEGESYIPTKGTGNF